MSSSYRQRLETKIGPVSDWLKVSELRRLPLGEVFKKLCSSDIESVYLLMEDCNSMALLPVLKIMTAICSTKRFIVMPDLSLRTFTRLSVFMDLVKIILASIHGQYVLKQLNWEVNYLLKSPLQAAKPNGSAKVFFLRTNLWYGVKAGGSVGHIAGVVNGLSRQGYEVHYVASELLPLIDSKVIAHPLKPLWAFGLPPEINPYRFSHGIVRQICDMNIDTPGFVYQRLSIGDYTGPKLARVLKVPLVIEYNGSEVWVANNWGTPLRYSKPAMNAEMACLRHAHLIVVVSEVLKEELTARGIPAEKILWYPNCIDPVLFNPERFDEPSKASVRQRYGISADATVVTFIGTFGEWHGVDILAQTIRYMVDKDEAWLREHRLHFLLIGDGLKMAKVLEILADERYKPYFTLTGLIDQDQAPAHLAASDVLAAPHISNPDGSRFFGSPTKLFEYMAMGKGIVASNLEQVGQVLTPGIHFDSLPDFGPNESDHSLAVLCKPGDIDSLRMGIRFLTEQVDWRDHLGKNARAEVYAKYTWDRHVKAILERVSQLGNEGGYR